MVLLSEPVTLDCPRHLFKLYLGRVEVRVGRRRGASHGSSPTDESPADSPELPATGLKGLSGKQRRSEPHLLTRPRPEIIFKSLSEGFRILQLMSSSG